LILQDGVNSYAGTSDTSIKSASQTTNFGTATTIEVNGGSSDIGALIKWNLSSIPAGSTVQSVKITLNITDASTQSYSIYELKHAWVESTATWKIWTTSQNWQTAGAAGANDRGTTALGTVVATPVGSGTTTLNASESPSYKNWINTASSNNGFILRTTRPRQTTSSSAPARRPQSASGPRSKLRILRRSRLAYVEK